MLTNKIGYFQYNLEKATLFKNKLFKAFIEYTQQQPSDRFAIFCDNHSLLGDIKIDLPIFNTKYLAQNNFNILTTASDEICHMYPTNRFITTHKTIACPKTIVIDTENITLEYLIEFLESRKNELV